MLRARALEQALRMLIDAAVQTACKIAEDGDRRWHVVDLVCATNDAEKLLAVDPPPSGASPQAETSEAEEKYGTAFGRLDRESIGEHIASIKRLMGIPATVSPVEPTTCPKCRSNTRAYRLAVADVIDGRMAGMTSCRDEWHSRMPMVSPVEPEPPTREPVWRCFHCDMRLTSEHAAREHFGPAAGSGTVCAVLGITPSELQRLLAPVEPEPPTEAQFGEYERLKRQAREIEKALREAGCPAMPLEQGVRWLANKDFTAPLPPRPPAVVKPHRYDLVRYGVTWEGQDNQPLLTPMPDGYWTPWHLAVEAPTVEPEPCVWRETENGKLSPDCDRMFAVPLGAVFGFKCCPYCGAPLKVER